MSDAIQKNAFIAYEADAWFQRNAGIITNYKAEEDHLLAMLSRHGANPVRILEIGCSAGYRLQGLKDIFPGAKISGIDPSKSAVQYGKSHYKEIEFFNGTIDDLSMFTNEEFDLVIIGFVFYVVDRNILLKSIAEIDRIIKDGGLLVIKDFFSQTPVKRNYHHISDIEVYSYKQLYETIFTASHLYHLICKESFDHGTSQPSVDTDYQDIYSISLLKKDLSAAYR